MDGLPELGMAGAGAGGSSGARRRRCAAGSGQAGCLAGACGHVTEEAGAAGRRPMPFTREQIAKLAELVRQYQRATAEGAGPAPSGRIRRALVEPGADGTVPVVEVRRGFTTVLAWTDTTGSPWPVEEVLVGQPVPAGGRPAGRGGGPPGLSRAEAPLPDGQSRGEAQGPGGAGGGDAARQAAEPKADFRVEMRLPRPGPGVDAAALMRPASFHAGDGELAGLLAGKAPGGAVRVELEGGGANDRAWRQGEDLLLLSRHVILSPGPWAAERGSGGRWAYRLPWAPVMWVSLDGRESRVSVRDAAPTVWAGSAGAER